jgi:prepilin-type N-terminal cleavage/methylation domain-containing protein
MNNHQSVERRESKIEGRTDAMWEVSCRGRRLFVLRRAFTLIELLVVIGIIAVLAALILPIAGKVKREAFIHTAQTEMSQIETAIERYKSVYGFYPPDNHNNPANPMFNQLYYELVGTTNVAAPTATPEYAVLGDPSQQLSGGSPGDVSKIFGVAGFMNCDKPGADESATHAQDFLPDLKPTQIAKNITNSSDPNVPFTLLVTSDGGPDPTYRPLGIQDVNPWRYNSSNPTNNPGSYDLYVQLVIAGKTNLVCNWSKQVLINNPLP